METKFYAPPQALHCLTITTHPGTLTEANVVDNLVRMSLMDDELSAEEAMEEARQLPTDKRKALVDDMWWEYNSPEFQDYLIRKQILPSKINEDNLKLVPITEAMRDEDENQITEEEALSRMWERLDEFNLDEFKMWELPVAEWD
jgi:hypothetical protein